MKFFLITLILMTCFLHAAESKETLVIWHALEGELGKVFDALLEDFKKQEPSMEIKASRTGNYDQNLDKFCN